MTLQTLPTAEPAVTAYSPAPRRTWRPAVLASIVGLAAIGAGPCAYASDPQPGPSLLEREALTGSWAGRRDAFREGGVELGLSIYNDAVAVVDGGLERDGFFPGLVEPTVALGLDELLGWDDTVVFFRGLGMYGGDPASGTGSLNAPSNLANSAQTFRLFEAWIEHRFLDDRLAILAGLYAVDNEFDVKETAGVFMNGGFGTGVDLSQSGPNGPCVFPASCLGVRARYLPTGNAYVQVAVLNGVAGDPDDPYGTDLVFDHDRYGLFTIAEAGYQRGADEGRFLRAGLGVWYYTAAFDDVKDTDAAGDPVQRHARPGLYAFLEGEIYREADRPAEGLTAFVRLGTADDDVHQVGQYASAGLARTGWLPGRDEDVTALGVSVPFNGDKYKSAQRQAGSPVDDAEVAVELAHYMQLTPWLGLQVGAQYFFDPGTDPAVDDAVLLDMRVQVAF